MSAVFFALIFVAVALFIGYAANRASRKIFPGRPKTTFRSVMITALAIAFGLMAGLVFIPVFMIPENSYVQMLSALGIVLLLGKVELTMLRRTCPKVLDAYILDDDIFPFGSLGIAVAFMFKPSLIAWINRIT